MVRTILVQATNIQKKYEMKDVMGIMKALDYIPYSQGVEPRKEGI